MVLFGHLRHSVENGSSSSMCKFFLVQGIIVVESGRDTWVKFCIKRAAFKNLDGG